MRLGQLSRKLAVRQGEIVDFLSSHNIQIEDGSNTRLEDDHVKLIVKHLAPEKEETIFASEASNNIELEQVLRSIEVSKIEEIVKPTAVEEVAASVVIEGISPNVILAEEHAVPTEDKETAVTPQVYPQELTLPDIIKAPKVELPGLKVLGKIEIPEPRKKGAADDAQVASETEEQDSKKEEDKAPQPERRMPREDRKPYAQKRERTEQRPRKNPVSLQREREQQEAEYNKREAAKREKERRTQNYLKKIKTAAPEKAARIIEDPLEVMSSAHQEEQPKGLWGRFVKWLRS